MNRSAWRAFRGLVLAGVLIGCASPAASQAPLWVARFNSGFTDGDACPGGCDEEPGTRSVVGDTQGNTYVAGHASRGGTSTFWVIKFGPDGATLWSAGDDGPGNSRAYAIAFDGSGAIYATGGRQTTQPTGLVTEACLTIKYAVTDGAILWARTYEAPGGSCFGKDIALDPAGNPVVTGFGGTEKYSAADGSVLWANNEAGIAGRAVVLDAQGNVLVTGTTGSGSNADIRTAKYAAQDGGLIWVSTYAGSAGANDEARAIALDSAGNAYVTGQSVEGGFIYGYRTIKYSGLDGSMLWSAGHGLGVGYSLASAVTVDETGDALVTGYAPGPKALTLRHAAADGSVIWRAELDGYAYAMARGADGGVYVTGRSWTGLDFDYVTARYEPASGALVWARSYDAPAHLEDEATAIAVAPSGGVLVAGVSDGGPSDDLRVVKYTEDDGTLLFTATEGQVAGATDLPSSSYSPPAPHGVVVAEDGSVYVTGSSHNGLNDDVRTVKYAADGALLWAASYAHPGDSDDRAFAIALDAAGNAYVTGSAYDRVGRTSDFLTVKHAAADGRVLWSVTYDGPTHGDDDARAIAVNAAGDTYVTGRSYGTHLDDFRTVKLASSDGHLLWTTSFVGARSDEAEAIALDQDGNAYVTGRVDNGQDHDFRTVKYAALDGRVLWSAAYDGGFADAPTDIAVDLQGNAYVTGTSSGTGFYDFRTVKHAASDGHVLWSATYDGADHGADGASAITLDDSGNAYVTGQSRAAGYTEMRVIKYAASNGQEAWTVRVEGAPGANEAGTALVVYGSAQVHVTGYSQFASRSQMVTATLGAENGATLRRSVQDAGVHDSGFGVATDEAGNLYASGVSVGLSTGHDFVILKFSSDYSSPNAPTSLSSSTHAPGVWSSRPQVVMSWSGAVDPPPASGLSGYSVVFDTSAGTLPDATVDVPQTVDPHGVASAPLPEGQSHYFHLRACDLGGNCSAAVHAGPYRIDTTAPSAPATVASSSHEPGVPSNEATLALQWTTAVDPLSNGVASGIDGYAWFLDDDASTACSQQKAAEEWTTSVSVPVALGTWYAHVCARDNAGNWSAVTSAGPYLIGDPADLSLSLTDDLDPMHVNGTVTYTAAYANAGPSPAPEATLTLALPAGLGFVASVPGEPVCSGSGQDVKCALGDLAASGAGTVEVTAQALPGTKGLQSASAKLRAAASDPALGNNVATQATLVKFVKGDLQDDWATDLFLANQTTNENVAWLMNGTTRLSEAAIDPPAPAHATQQVAGVDDFDGDGQNDLAFWDSATGEVELWLMNGPTRPGDPVALSGAAPLPPAWKLSATADFDRDGWPDLLWRNADTQKLAIWTLNGTSKKGELVPSPDQAAHANWQVVGAVDLNGDGNVDLLWYNVSTGKIVYWWMDASVQRITGNFTNPASAGNANWKVLATGDYGAGSGGAADTADLVWRNETSGKYVVWHLDLAGNRTAGTFTTPDAPASPLDWTVVGPR